MFLSVLDIYPNIFLRDLSYSDVAKIKEKIEYGDPPLWEGLIIELVDKGIISAMSTYFLIGDCKYPQASQVGELFFNKLKNQLPNLTVEQLMAGCKKTQRYDVCQRLQEHLSTYQQQQQRVIDLPPAFRKDLEKMIGFSHYPEFPGSSWKILAEVS